MTERKIMSIEWRIARFLDNYFKKRSKPLTEGTYNQFKSMAEGEYNKEVASQ